MHSSFTNSISLLALALQCCHAQDMVTMPNPNGSYVVGWNTTEMVDTQHTAPFAPDTEPRKMELSVFYPVDSGDYTSESYFPPEVALVEDIENAAKGLASPNGTFETLNFRIASNDSQIASPSGGSTWPVLLFSPASGTTRLFYNYLLSNIASYGYVVVAFDTPYDTDVVQFSDGSTALGNDSIKETACDAITAINARAQDASFILDQLKNDTLVSSIIPGCDKCLNIANVGAFGHSVGGAMATTLLSGEPRVASALNYDGAIWGDIVQKGSSKPYMLMATTDQTIESMNTPDNPDSSWAAIWPRLTGSKTFVMLNNSLHYTYSDLPLAIQTLGIQTDNNTEVNELITELDGKRATQIISAYTLAFFNQTLGNQKSDLLSGPSPDYPEITFDNYTATTSNASTSAIYLCASSAATSKPTSAAPHTTVSTQYLMGAAMLSMLSSVLSLIA